MYDYYVSRRIDNTLIFLVREITNLWLRAEVGKELKAEGQTQLCRLTRRTSIKTLAFGAASAPLLRNKLLAHMDTEANRVAVGLLLISLSYCGAKRDP